MITKRHLISIAIIMGASALSWGMPARPGFVKVSQPDGTELLIQKIGNHSSHITLNEEGLPIEELADGTFVFAQVDDAGLLKPTDIKVRPYGERSVEESARLKEIAASFDAAAVLNRISEINPINKNILPYSREKNIAKYSPSLKAASSSDNEDKESVKTQWGLATDPLPFVSTGDRRAIVVVVEYKDVKFTLEDPLTHFDNLLNQEGYSNAGATGSARDWFIDNSKNQFRPVFDVYGPIALPQNMSFYGGNDSYGNDKAAEMMVIHALDAIDKDVDLSVYDTNGDGKIDNVYVFYAGKGENDGGRSSSVWPHSYDITAAQPTKKYVYDGVIADHYACSNELSSEGKYDGIGTFVHEFSHVMGLPDLYCTNNSYSTATPGYFSVLDYGPYLNSGNTPPNYSTYERYSLGWLTPKRFKGSGEYTLENLQDSNDAYVIDATEDGHEYYAFENRQNTGWDRYLPAHGMFVWHVDYDERKWNENTVNNSTRHQYVDLIEADNKSGEATQKYDAFPSSRDYTEFGPETTPALQSWAGEALPYSFSDIAENDGLITFNLITTVEPGDDPNKDPNDDPNKDPNDDPNKDPNGDEPGSGIGEVNAQIDGVVFENGSIQNLTKESIEVFSISGIKVRTVQSGDASNLPKGIYIVRSSKGILKGQIK